MGPNNYGHPTSTALNLYRKVGANVFRTDLQGTVTVTVQPGGAYRITTEKGTVTPAAVSASPTPAPVVPATPANVTYPNCAAVRAAGKSPLLRGQPGYSTKLDRDGDGRACE
ncbi:excalibur calcium-binding domain-containing protein [Deinococcus sp. ME38]|uniref:excalibur calcium-binding domain-containing protein n=1 Tax=Deinococcus sp. ME38 TaxID=3400344 RepID=UPI003B5BDBDA